MKRFKRGNENNPEIPPGGKHLLCPTSWLNTRSITI
jgi:hypothetical protein